MSIKTRLKQNEHLLNINCTLLSIAMNPESHSGDIGKAMDSPELVLFRHDDLCASGTADTVPHDCGAASLFELVAVPDVVTKASRLDSEVLSNST